MPRILFNKSIEDEYKINNDLKIEDIKLLKNWCSSEKHLPKNISDLELYIFLHSNYYKINETQKSIEAFFTIRSNVKEFFCNRDHIGCKDLRDFLNVCCYLPLEQTTREGYKVIVSHMFIKDSSRFNFNECMKFFTMVLDLWIYSEGPIKGHVLIFDIDGFSFGHATKLSISGLKKFLNYLQDALPVRLKSMHYLNTNKMMDMILSMVKPFMKKELLNMINFHSSLESLDKVIPIEILPNELGGKAGPIMDLHNAQIKCLEDNRDWFAEDEKYFRVNESLREKK